MKTYLKKYQDRSNCAHAWANQLTVDGYASNLYFEGNTIYSYGPHFPIAIMDGNIVFFTTKGYSMTTSHHKSLVLGAISHKEIVYVDHLTPTDNPLKDRVFIAKNINGWIITLKEIVAEYNRNKRKKTLIRTAGSIISNLRKFINVLDSNDRAEYLRLIEQPGIRNLIDFVHDQFENAARHALHTKQLFQERFAQSLKKWKQGLIHSLRYNNQDDPNLAYLRLNPETGNIETSKKITISLKESELLFHKIESVIRSHQSYGELTIKGFKVSKISTDYLEVGCHKIPMEEVRAIAEKLGWIGMS